MRLFRTAAAASLLVAAVTLAPRDALAFGAGTHAGMTRDAAKKLRSDPKTAFVDQDDEMRDCFALGGIFPDYIWPANTAANSPAQIDQLKKTLESHKAIKRVDISGQDIKTISVGSHGRDWLLFLVDRAEQSGDKPFFAFALGNLAHGVEDMYADTFSQPHYVVRTGSGDLGVGPAQNPATLASWGPGDEIHGFQNNLVDSKRSRSDILGVRDLPRGLVKRGWFFTRTKRSLQRWAEIKHRFYLVMKEYAATVLHDNAFITELGFQNAEKFFEIFLTVYPYVMNAESSGDMARAFVDRFVDLAWWADALLFIGNTITRLITFGQLDLFKIGACLGHLDDRVAKGLDAQDTSNGVSFAFIHGGQLEKDCRRRYAANVEFQRLLASGLLDKATYDEPMDLGVDMTADQLIKRRASKITDWGGWRTNVLQSAGIGGLAKLMGAGSGYAAEPALLVWDVRWLDPATGAAVKEIKYPNDVGRPLRVQIELFAPVADPSAIANGRAIAVTVRSDRGAGRADPVVATATTQVPASALTPTNYVSVPRPVLTLDFTAPADAAQAGVYLEIDAGRGVFFTTNMAPFAPLTNGRAQYAKSYVTYGAFPPSIQITR